jgi:cytochrome c-type biogenesis protein CcmF
MFAMPVVISLIASTIVFLAAGIYTISHIVLLTAAIYGVVANGAIVYRLLSKKGLRLSGGAVAHMGIALMLLGILFSSGYKQIISLNNTGLLYSREMSDEMNRENVLLFINEARQMNDYTLLYKGQHVEVEGVPGYIDKDDLLHTHDPYLVVAKADYVYKGATRFAQGDTLQIRPENTYYEVEYQKNGETAFTLYPRAQVNPNMGLIVSPDILRRPARDLYTHIASIPDPESEEEWSDTTMHRVKIGERFFINDYVAMLKGVQRVQQLDDVELGPGDVAVQAMIELYGETRNYTAQPVFIIKDRMVGNIPDEVSDLGMRVAFMNVKPDDDHFEFASQSKPKDYIIMKAIEMPWINVLWIGTIVLMIGFGISIYRRYQDFRTASI